MLVHPFNHGINGVLISQNWEVIIIIPMMQLQLCSSTQCTLQSAHITNNAVCPITVANVVGFDTL